MAFWSLTEEDRFRDLGASLGVGGPGGGGGGIGAVNVAGPESEGVSARFRGSTVAVSIDCHGRPKFDCSGNMLEKSWS